MERFTRNVSIRTAVLAAMGSFILLIAALIALNIMTDRLTQQHFDTMTTISSDQLNELNRGDSLLNQALVEMERAIGYIVTERSSMADETLSRAEDRIERAEARFTNFIDAPRSASGEELAQPLIANYEQVMAIINQKFAALESGDLAAFEAQRDEMRDPFIELALSITNFTDYGFSLVDEIEAELQSQRDLFNILYVAAAIVVILLVLAVYFGLKRIVTAPLDDAVRRLNKISDADLTEPLPAAGKNEIGRLFAAMGSMQENLTRLVVRVRSGSSEIHHGTREISQGNTDLSSRTEQQAASIEQTAASMEEMTATVKQNADNARQASSLAGDASTTAERGGQVVEEVVQTMHGISKSSQQVADITSVIDSIAFQTNILALNASVEAARAGEQGRGFAVVAGEVRNLASRSADAAKEIKELIDDSVKQISQGSTLVEQAGATMTDVVSAVRRVTDIMDEISAASQEQSDGIEQVSQAVGQMDEVTQQNAALVQQAAAAAVSLEDQARQLEEAVLAFKVLEGQHNLAARPAGGSSSSKALASVQTPTSAQAPASDPVAPRPKPRASAVEEWESF